MIRPAKREDVGRMLALIRELADYEHLEHEVEASAESLGEHLFGDAPSCSALVACEADDHEADDHEAEDGEAEAIVGYALYFPCYSTFKTRPTLFLEDLYVTPAARGRGHGKTLLAAVAAAARELGAARMDWNVLAWNQPAIEFYQALGAGVLPDWRVCRIDGEALQRLATGG
ncbi:MAG: GNAT family N-acetyltransferase [Planctomycetota bacterium]|jgi:GNAT superfamily N-acetyltransferase